MARLSTATVDEFADIPAGLAMWRESDFGMDSRNPPLLKLVVALPAHVMEAVLPPPAYRPPSVGWWPWIHGTRFLRDNADRYELIVMLGRGGVIALAAVLGVVLWSTARRLHGDLGGLVSLSLYVLSPSVLTHGSLATTDLGAALWFFSACVATDWYLRTGRRVALGATGLLAGAALATKFSTVLLFPGLGLALLWARRRQGLAGFGAAAANLGIIVLLALVVVQAAYFCPGGIVAGSADFVPRSDIFRVLAARAPGLPLPLPPDFVRGFDDALAYSRDPELPGYLDGVWSKNGFWRYHLEAFLLKEPLPLLALLLLALLPLRRIVDAGGRSGAALVLPPLLLLFSLIAWNRVQYGLRYALPLYPFLFLWAGRVAADGRGGRIKPIAVTVLLVLLCASVLRIHPHELSYFNMLGGGPTRGFRHLADSNIDWGQDLRALSVLLREKYPGRRVKLAYFGHVDPAHYGIDYEILVDREGARGLIAVSASYLAGEPYGTTWRSLVPDPVPAGVHTWLADLTPVDRVGYSIYLYEIP